MKTISIRLEDFIYEELGDDADMSILKSLPTR